MTSLLEKLKSMLTSLNFKTVLIVCLGVAVVYLLWVSWWTPEPVDSQALLKEMRTEVATEVAKKGKASEETVKKIAARLSAIEKTNVALGKKVEELKNEAATITAPKTNKELRDRFTKRGFPPLP